MSAAIGAVYAIAALLAEQVLCARTSGVGCANGLGWNKVEAACLSCRTGEFGTDGVG